MSNFIINKSNIIKQGVSYKILENIFFKIWYSIKVFQTKLIGFEGEELN